MKPCTHCGDCCRAELCEAAKRCKLTGPPCEAMIVRGRGWYCLLIDTERKMGVMPLQALQLGIGMGCTNEHKLSGLP